MSGKVGTEPTFFMVADPVLNCTDAPVVAIVVGEVGYFPIYTMKTADELNCGKLPDDVAEAAIAGSMFGWDCPGAAAAVAYANSKAA